VPRACRLAAHKLPLLGQIGPHNFHLYEDAAKAADATDPNAMGSGRSAPLFWLFLNSSCCEEANAHVRSRVVTEARTWAGRARFVWLDGERYEMHARSLAVSNGLLPALAAEQDGSHFVYPGDLLLLPSAAVEGVEGGESAEAVDSAEAERLGAWVSAVMAGAVQPTIRSQPPPLLNHDPVTVVVGSTFEEVRAEQETRDSITRSAASTKP
jgi:hypothetical protein